MEATYAVILMLVGGAVATSLAGYWIFGGISFLGGLFYGVLGVAYILGGRDLHRGRNSGWAVGMAAGALLILDGLFRLPWAAVPMVPAISVMILLYRSRAYFGIIRYDPEVDERAMRELEAARTSNPDGLHCPHCGSLRLWLALDGSAYCQDCRVGTMSLRRPA